MAFKATLLEHPLNWVFSAPSHIAVLRALRDSQEGMSGRAVAREAGINHQACALALRRLESLGVVRRQGSGRTQLVRLNFDNLLVKEVLLALVRKERDFWTGAREEIARRFKPSTLSATLFGSAARRETQPGSDVDLLLSVKPTRKAEVMEQARHFSQQFKGKYGIRLSPIVLTIKEVKERIRKSDPLLKNILRDGVDLLPSKIKQLAS